MRKLKEIRDLIEKKRAELNESYVHDEYSVYYAKSLELDKLLEEYLELQKEETTT